VANPQGASPLITAYTRQQVIAFRSWRKAVVQKCLLKTRPPEITADLSVVSTGTSPAVELALSSVDQEEARMLNSRGWQVRDGLVLSMDIFSYHDYLVSSCGEFTVAKDQNVRLRSGWFSDRSACYLAAGRPVVTQDTGFGGILPTGEGLFAFNTIEDILAAFDAIRSNYARHSCAARVIAERYFKAETVLARMLDQLDL
jgi:hypothetical protein